MATNVRVTGVLLLLSAVALIVNLAFYINSQDGLSKLQKNNKNASTIAINFSGISSGIFGVLFFLMALKLMIKGETSKTSITAIIVVAFIILLAALINIAVNGPSVDDINAAATICQDIAKITGNQGDDTCFQIDIMRTFIQIGTPLLGVGTFLPLLAVMFSLHSNLNLFSMIMNLF
jgi:hypothetical protein